MFGSQSGNSAGGDIVGGNKVTTITQIGQPQLARLYEKLRAASAAHPPSAEIADQLQHFCTIDTDGDVRGLAEKLTSAQRTDLIRMASRLKEAAAKTIMKWQTSGVAQDILTLVLAQMFANFWQYATPAIQEGASRSAVDEIIGDKVLAPASEMLGDNDLMLSQQDLLGLLFFLGGNCHIRWDAC